MKENIVKSYKTCFALLASLLLTVAGTFADNPIIPNQGVCDPHIRIFNNKAFLFSSHDFGKGEKIYKMVDWQLFSSSDLVAWKKEFVLRPEDTYIGPWHECYAPDGATRNGKYYFYFSQQQKQAWVAISDKPEGPYVDALKKPLLPEKLTPSAEYDMSVFTDDDKARTPYIVWGYTVANKDYYIARLNEDMISLAEAPRKIVIQNGWKNDAPALHKYNGTYYLNAHGAQYATATNVYGPYIYRGQWKATWTDHGSVFHWNNQAFHIYGVRDQGDPFFRTTKIQYIHYKDNGDIVVDQFIEDSPLGVGQYDPAWLRTEAEWYFAASGGLEKREILGGFEIRGITDGSWLRFPKVQEMTEGMLLNFRVSSANPDGSSIEIRQDTPDGPLLGSITVADTEGWEAYKTVTTKLKNKAGTQDLCFVFKGKGNELMRLDWWNTDKSVVNTKLTRYEAENAKLSGTSAAGDNLVGFSGNGFVRCHGGKDDGSVSFTVHSGSGGDRLFKLRYSAGAGNQAMTVYVNASKVLIAPLTGTGTWDAWTDYFSMLKLPGGPCEIKLVPTSDVCVDYIEIDGSGDFVRPYHGKSAQLPGRIQVEDYDRGGYRDTDLQNHGGVYRPDEPVDIGKKEDKDGGFFLGWFGAGEWLEYTVDINPGTYTLNLCIASMGDGQQVELSLAGKILARIDIPSTGGFQKWQTVTVQDINLPNGQNQILRITSLKGGPNIDWIEFIHSKNSRE